LSSISTFSAPNPSRRERPPVLRNVPFARETKLTSRPTPAGPKEGHGERIRDLNSRENRVEIAILKAPQPTCVGRGTNA